MINIKKYNIELSKLNKIIYIIVLLCSFGAVVFGLLSMSKSILSDVLWEIMFIIITYQIIRILNSSIKINQESILINSGLIMPKKIMISDISKVYEAKGYVGIKRGDPAFSKNIVAIEYEHGKIIYISISIKEKYEFINSLNQLIADKSKTDTLCEAKQGNSLHNEKRYNSYNGKVFVGGGIACLLTAVAVLIFIKIAVIKIVISISSLFTSGMMFVFSYLFRKDKFSKKNFILLCLLPTLIITTILIIIVSITYI